MVDFHDFIIGKSFFTAAGEWICIDIGTRCVVAVKADPLRETLRQSFDYDKPKNADLLTHANLAEEIIFWSFDFEGCTSQPFLENEDLPVDECCPKAVVVSETGSKNGKKRWWHVIRNFSRI